MNAVIYKRVSVLKNNIDGTSLDVQQERLEAYAKAQGWTVIGTYEDAGISGKDTNRPDLQRMLKDAENHKFDVILVYKLDRLSRSVSDFHQLTNFLDSHQIALVSVTQHLDTSTPTGRLLRNILVDFANFERELIRERIVDNKSHRAQEGKWNGGFAPFGYKLIDKKPVLVPEEAEKVRQVYQLYLTGKKSMRQIAKEIGLAFSRVDLILTNPIYTGKIAWGKTQNKNNGGKFKRLNPDNWIMADGEHEAIITFNDWIQAQEIKKKKAFTPGDTKGRQIFKDLCFCGECGRRLYYYSSMQPNQIEYSYYRCHSSNKFDGCGKISVRQDELEKKVVMKIHELLSNKMFWKEAKNRLKQNDPNSLVEKQLKEISRKMNMVDEKIKNLVNQLADGAIAHLIKPKLLELEEEKKMLISKRYDYEFNLVPNSDLDIDAIKKIMQEVVSNWDELLVEEKLEGISLLISSITSKDGMVFIDWTEKNLPQSQFQLDKRSKNGRITAFRF